MNFPDAVKIDGSGNRSCGRSPPNVVHFELARMVELTSRLLVFASWTENCGVIRSGWPDHAVARSSQFRILGLNRYFRFSALVRARAFFRLPTRSATSTLSGGRKARRRRPGPFHGRNSDKLSSHMGVARQHDIKSARRVQLFIQAGKAVGLVFGDQPARPITTGRQITAKRIISSPVNCDRLPRARPVPASQASRCPRPPAPPSKHRRSR